MSLVILGIPGSLRLGSHNMAAMKAARELAPDDVAVEIFERLGELPLFNQDHETKLPDVVKDLKRQIRRADAILFATSEYNYLIFGVLKNSIDWASRPYGDNAWEKKPVAVMSASISMQGGSLAQYHLRQVFVFLNMFPLNRPEVIIPEVADKVDDHGRITDAHTREKIGEMVGALVEWVRVLKEQEYIGEELPKERYPYDNAYNRPVG